MSESVKGEVQAVSIRGDKDNPKQPIEGKFGNFYNVGIKVEDKWYNKSVMGNTQSDAGKAVMVFAGDTVELKVSENKILKDGIKVIAKSLRAGMDNTQPVQVKTVDLNKVSKQEVTKPAYVPFVRDDFGPTFGGMAKIALDLLKHNLNNPMEIVSIDELMEVTAELTQRALEAKAMHNNTSQGKDTKTKENSKTKQSDENWS